VRKKIWIPRDEKSRLHDLKKQIQTLKSNSSLWLAWRVWIMAMFGLLLSGRLVDTSFRPVDNTHVVIDVANVDTANHLVVFLTGQQPFPDGVGGAVYLCWGGQHWQYLGAIANDKPSAIFKIGKPKGCAGTANGLTGAALSARFGGQHASNGSAAQLGISLEPLGQLSGLTPDAGAGEAAAVPTFLQFSQKMVESLFNYTSRWIVANFPPVLFFARILNLKDIIKQKRKTQIPCNGWQRNARGMLAENNREMANSLMARFKMFNIAFPSPSFAVTPSQLASSSSASETYVPLSSLRNWYNTFERRLQQNPNFWRSWVNCS